MTKFPSSFAGGTVPSGNSFAVTYPGVRGSRAGGTGRSTRCTGAEAGVCPPACKTANRQHTTPPQKQQYTLIKVMQPFCNIVYQL